MIDLGQILTGIVRRTAEGKLKWSPSADSDQFVTSVDAISIVIAEIGPSRRPRYRLEIFDESGETVDSLDVPECDCRISPRIGTSIRTGPPFSSRR